MSFSVSHNASGEINGSPYWYILEYACVCPENIGFSLSISPEKKQTKATTKQKPALIVKSSVRDTLLYLTFPQ